MELTEIRSYVLDKNYESKIKMGLFRLLFSAILLLNSYLVVGQIEKGENIFGFQVGGIIPVSFLNAGSQTVSNDSIAFTLSGASGYTVGGIIRHNFSRMFTLETGIHYVNRKYSFNFKHNIQGIDDNSSVNLVSFGIPVQWLLYIRLGERFYMNTLFGVSFDIYPSEVTKNHDSYRYIIIRDSWLNVALTASIGFEYRTKKSGYFYLGGSLQYPLSDIGFVRVSYIPDINDLNNFVNLDVALSGTYFSVNLRYFFEKTEIKNEPTIYR